MKLFLRSTVSGIAPCPARAADAMGNHPMKDNRYMKTKSELVLAALALALSAGALTAQDADGPPPGGGRPGSGPGADGQRPPPRRQGGPGMDGQRPPLPPIITALDLNHDGIIDADEIAKASESLKKLDKNGDGSLTPDELRPQPGGPGNRDGGPGPGQPGARGPRGQGGEPEAGANPPPLGDDGHQGPPRGQGPGPQGGPDGPRPPMPPIIAALDLNHDGIIDADEIAKAPESLKKLDKNGDGNLTPDELRPPRPGGSGGDRPQPPAGRRPSNE